MILWSDQPVVLDANEIVPGLWQGSVPPRGGLLASLGFHTLVLTALEWQIPALEFPGLAVIHAPNNDDGSPLTRGQLDLALTAARQVVARLQSGQKVLVTCAAGVNRSGLVSALSLHFLKGWSGDKCIAVVRKRRQTRQMPLCNPFFTAALRKLPATTPKPKIGPGGIYLRNPV